ncbi:hypothetical protein D3C71_766460 [compost metagenome]
MQSPHIFLIWGLCILKSGSFSFLIVFIFIPIETLLLMLWILFGRIVNGPCFKPLWQWKLFNRITY